MSVSVSVSVCVCVCVGTVLSYSPGLLLGGSVEHDCSAQRGVGYSLEPLLLLAPFAKDPLQVTLRGITTATALDPSVSVLQVVACAVLIAVLAGRLLSYVCPPHAQQEPA